MERVIKGREAIRQLVEAVRKMAPVKPSNRTEVFLAEAALAPQPEELSPLVVTQADLEGALDDPAHPRNRYDALNALALSSRRTIRVDDLGDLETWSATDYSVRK